MGAGGAARARAPLLAEFARCSACSRPPGTRCRAGVWADASGQKKAPSIRVRPAACLMRKACAADARVSPCTSALQRATRLGPVGGHTVCAQASAPTSRTHSTAVLQCPCKGVRRCVNVLQALVLGSLGAPAVQEGAVRQFAGLCAQEREHASACAHAAGPPLQQARRSSSNGRAVCAALRLAALAGRSRARVRASRKPAIGHASHSQLRVLCKLSCPCFGQQVRSCRVQGRGLQHAREYEASMVRRTCLARVISWASLLGPVQAATARLGARFIAGPFRFVALADVTG